MLFYCRFHDCASEHSFSPPKDIPEITFISDNQTVNQGGHVNLRCTADGYPTPSITWTKVSDNSEVSFPLTINGKQSEGLYRCTADNGIRSPVTEEVAIIVHSECLNKDIVDLYLIAVI